MSIILLPAPPAPWAGVAAYAAGVVYSAGPPASVVTFNGSTYVYVNAVPHAGIVPGTDPATWMLVAGAGANGGNELPPAVLAADTPGTLVAGYADVAGMLTAPNTTSPIEAVIEGGIKFTLAAVAGNIVARFQVVDDQGAVYGPVQVTCPIGPVNTNVFLPVHFSIPITPASAARTYKLQTSTATLPAGSSWTMVGTATWPSAGFALKPRLR